MADIDIPVPDEIARALAAPRCLDVKLPAPQQLQLTLPSGGRLTALTDLGKGIPNDCSLTFSLMIQLGPILASLDCVIKILKLLKPLSDAVTSPPPGPGTIKDIVEAAADLAPCFLMVTPAGMLPFVKDILCLILKALRCLIGQLDTLLRLTKGIEVNLEVARAAGNADLVATLECARGNAEISAQHLLQAFEPILVLLDMVEPLTAIAGIDAVKLPALGGGSDVAALETALDALRTGADTLQAVTDALGGCG
jgi:hypothetical protein